MSLQHQHVTWQTGSRGDTVKVYATADPDGEGGVAIWWHWRRKHSSGHILARSAEPKKRRRDALWEARRVNPPLPEVMQRVQALAEAWDDGYNAAQLDADEIPYSDHPSRATWKPRANPHRTAALRGSTGGGT